MITATSRSSPTTARVRSVSVRRVRTVELQGPAGRLEAVVNEGSPQASFAAVVCHPHPLGGGSLHNKVVYHAMKAMNAPEFGLGWPVLRFNFRGTGRSEGVHDGAAETGDVLAALEWLENEYNLPLVVTGFSFGAAMSLAACCGNGDAAPRTIDIRVLAAIGLPVRTGAVRPDAPIYDYSFLADCRIPKLFLSGDHDQYATEAELIRAVAAAAEPKQVALVPGADHFFTGHLEAMQSVLLGWLKEQVYDPGQRSGI
jgi:alpha/beta superfamily hydrolase